MNQAPAPRATDDRPAAHAAHAAPVEAGARIDTLDFLRGIAVMGILAANIIPFGQPFEAGIYPGAFLTDPGDPGSWLWTAQFVAIDGKMRGLFTLLFGAGLFLFMERAGARGATWRLQAWRLAILMGFGLIHFFLIWNGDILFSYAVFGLAALACVRWSAPAQVAVGLGAYAFGAVYYALTYTSGWLIADTAIVPSTAEQRAVIAAAVDAAIVRAMVPADMIAAGEYGALLAYRLTEEWSSPLRNALLFAWETLPLMLIGMGLYRLGFFHAAPGRRRMLVWGWCGVIAGGAAHGAIALAVKAGGISYFGAVAAFLGLSPLPRLWMVLGLAALLVVRAPSATGWLGERVRAAGRAAFTNYLGTSVVMMILFHGWGLGLFGLLNRPQLYGVMVLSWAVMLAWSKPWLDRYRYGPLEWLWRCLTYRTVFPLKK